MRVLHLAPTLEVGGTERFIGRLAPTLAARHGVEQRVVGIAGDGPVGDGLRQAGIAAEAFPAGGVAQLPTAVRRVRSIVDEWRADIVQTWLYRADLTGALATIGRRDVRLVWNLRCSDLWLKLPTRAVRRACTAIAGTAPDAIIACGERAAAFHQRLGYPAGAMTVIPNGYRFPAWDGVLAARASRRPRIPDAPLVIGAAGRYDRAKGYPVLLEALALLTAGGIDVRLTIAGRGCEGSNSELMDQINRLGLQRRTDLRGELSDMQTFYAGLDLFCLSSVSEGFPNVLCEAIAAGVPAVATDVGDAAQIVGPDGTVPPGSAEALANGMATILGKRPETREADALTAARRVRDAYDLDRVADQYQTLYRSLID